MSKTIGRLFGYTLLRSACMSLSRGELVPQLIEVSGGHPGRVHDLPYGTHVLGRGHEADIQLHDKDVSRRHARLEVTAEGVLVHDLGSKNGVVVRGQRVVQPVRLQHGETLSIGDLTLSLSHPASQVAKALQFAGETTVTTTRTYDTPKPESAGLLLPLVGVAVFGVAAVLLLFFA